MSDDPMDQEFVRRRTALELAISARGSLDRGAPDQSITETARKFLAFLNGNDDHGSNDE